MAEDDDSGDDFQFKFNVSLRVDSIYILVVTTYYPGKETSYSVLQAGPLTTTTTRTAVTTTPRATITITTTPRTTTTVCKSLYLEGIGLIISYRYLYQFFPRLCIICRF
jgi:hypothetical protein